MLFITIRDYFLKKFVSQFDELPIINLQVFIFNFFDDGEAIAVSTIQIQV